MSDLDVGKHGTYHSEPLGDIDCKVVDYRAGRPHGDHLIEYTDGADGTGVVHRIWTVVGDELGAFETH